MSRPNGKLTSGGQISGAYRQVENGENCNYVQTAQILAVCVKCHVVRFFIINPLNHVRIYANFVSCEKSNSIDSKREKAQLKNISIRLHVSKIIITER